MRKMALELSWVGNAHIVLLRSAALGRLQKCQGSESIALTDLNHVGPPGACDASGRFKVALHYTSS